MKRIASILGVMALALLLTSGITLAQQMEMSQPMMCSMCPMMPRMMGGGMMLGGMMGEGMMVDPVCRELHQFGGPGFYGKYADGLGLSDQQVNDLKAIWSKYKKGVILKKADIQIAKIELGEILGQDTIDFSKAKAKITQIGSLKQDIRLDHLSSIEKAQKVLTTEQLAKFKTLKKKGGKGMMKSGMRGMGMMKKGE